MIGLETLLLIVILAIISAIVYIIIGILPGTDETATMAPIALALLIAGLDPLLVLAWFIASIIAFKTADAVPVALAGIPGGVMAVPQVPDAVEAKKAGKADVILRKGVISSMIASFVALILVLILAFYLKPLGDFLNTKDAIAGVSVPRWFWLLFGGLILLAVTSRNRWLALLSIPTFTILIQGLRLAYEKNVIISFFLGITIGPLIIELLEVLSGYARDKVRRGYLTVKLDPISSIPLNPLRHLSREELAHVLLWPPIASVLAMVMSPVGLTILIGDVIKSFKKTQLEASILAYTVRDGIKNASYIGGLLIPLLVIGSPTGPMSAGPGLPFFTEVGGVIPAKYITSNYSYLEVSIALLLSAIVAALVVYPILIKYSRKLTLLVFRSIPAESLYGLFISIVVLLAYYDAGLRGVLGVLVVSVISGVLWRNGVSLGVLFMTLVAAPTLFAFIKLI